MNCHLNLDVLQCNLLSFLENSDGHLAIRLRHPPQPDFLVAAWFIIFVWSKQLVRPRQR